MFSVRRWRSSGVEQLFCKQRVGGSNPSASYFECGVRDSECGIDLSRIEAIFFIPHSELSLNGELPKRTKGTDCKSVGFGLRRFESFTPQISGVVLRQKRGGPVHKASQAILDGPAMLCGGESTTPHVFKALHFTQNAEYY